MNNTSVPISLREMLALNAYQSLVEKEPSRYLKRDGLEYIAKQSFEYADAWIKVRDEVQGKVEEADRTELPSREALIAVVQSIDKLRERIAKHVAEHGSQTPFPPALAAYEESVEEYLNLMVGLIKRHGGLMVGLIKRHGGVTQSPPPEVGFCGGCGAKFYSISDVCGHTCPSGEDPLAKGGAA